MQFRELRNGAWVSRTPTFPWEGGIPFESTHEHDANEEFLRGTSD